MKYIPFLFLLQLLPWYGAMGQTLEAAAVGHRDQVRRAYRQEWRSLAHAQAGLPAEPEAGGFLREGACPPMFEGLLVRTGETLVIPIDTFGFGGGTVDPVLTVTNAGTLNFGTVTVLPQSIEVSYAAQTGLLSGGVDTVEVRYVKGPLDTLVRLPVHVTRLGRALTGPLRSVGPGSVGTYCYGGLADFDSPSACTELLGSARSYDGIGEQLYHFTDYWAADTCLVYYASRFPGMDTVSVLMCDERAVCDTFLLPFRILGDTIDALPFFEDFSGMQGPYPTVDRWLDKSVFVNQTLAFQPPSTGFATFDGLDRRGDVYPFFNQVGDRLTSRPIDLSAQTPFTNVVLRFFLAPKGYGLAPEETDYFILEFRNAQREWIPIDSIPGLDDVSITEFPPFQFHAYPIADPQFLHGAFQFRFSAVTSPGGEVDLWHLDYVFLDDQSTVTDFFGDLAFTGANRSVLRNYTALPLAQLQAGLSETVLSPGDTLRYSIFNHFNDTRSFADSRVSFRETTTGQQFSGNFTLADAGGSNTAPKEHRTIGRALPLVMDAIRDDLGALPGGADRLLETTFSFTPNASQESIFTGNDTLRLYNHFSDYFAHDDGTAEWQFYIKSATGGEQMAAGFQAYAADTLKAVRILFPHVNTNVEGQVFTLRVWVGSLDSEPVFERELLKPYYPNNVLDTLQGYTTYLLDDYIHVPTPVFIPEGGFFVGIVQSSAAAYGIPVGYDLQNDCQCNFVNIAGIWESFPPDYPGSLMIRPVFGNTVPTTSHASGVGEGAQSLHVFPNPAGRTIRLSWPASLSERNSVVRVIDLRGQVLREQALQPELDLSGISDGMYLVQVTDTRTGLSYHSRLVVSRAAP